MKKKIISLVAAGLFLICFTNVNALTEVSNILGVSFEASESTKLDFALVDDQVIIITLDCEDYNEVLPGGGGSAAIQERRVCLVPGGEPCTVAWVDVTKKIGSGTCLIIPQ